MIQIFWIVLEIIIIYNCFIRVNKDFVIFCKHLSRDHLHLLFNSQGFFIIIIARLANYVSLSSRKESQIEAQVDFSQRLRTFICLHGKGRWRKIEKKCGFHIFEGLTDILYTFQTSFSANKMIRNEYFSRVLTSLSKKLSWKQTFHRNSKIFWRDANHILSKLFAIVVETKCVMIDNILQESKQNRNINNANIVCSLRKNTNLNL